MHREISNGPASDRHEDLFRALEKSYPDAGLALQFSNAFELLVAVLLSAQCTDERVNRVTAELFRTYSRPEDFLTISLEDLEQLIRSTGFYRNKAKSLRGCCEMLVERHGGQVPGRMEDLVRLPGVGRKTAAMVLGNAFHSQQGLAVDTHVKRVAQRTGLSGSKTPAKIERDLMNRLPRDRWTWASNALILHGRHTCTARKPACPQCCIQNWCDFEAKTRSS